MNAARKLIISNVLTSVVTILAAIQVSLTPPVFTIEQVTIFGAIITFVSIGLTALKQYLSVEVDSSGHTVTLYVLGATVLTALLALLKVFHFSDVVQHRIDWIVTLLIAVINILSKSLFPSQFQRNKIETLKTTTSTNVV